MTELVKYCIIPSKVKARSTRIYAASKRVYPLIFGGRRDGRRGIFGHFKGLKKSIKK